MHDNFSVQLSQERADKGLLSVDFLTIVIDDRENAIGF